MIWVFLFGNVCILLDFFMVFSLFVYFMVSDGWRSDGRNGRGVR